MKNHQATKSMRRSLPVFAQIVHLIPAGLIDSVCEAQKIKARVFSYAHQIYSLLLGQLSGAWSLNEICDGEQVHRKKLLRIRGILPARRNTFSNANRTRDPVVAETLFWRVHDILLRSEPHFFRKPPKGKLARFRMRRIFAVDSTTLQLTLKAIDWAQHRRRKAAAKLHMLCDVATRLPVFARVTSAKMADCRAMATLCARLKAGDVAIFDRAYNDFGALATLAAKCVFFVVREKERMKYKVMRRRPKRELPANVISDEEIRLTGAQTCRKYPQTMRRIRARVEVDGRMRELVFLTNNMDWSPSTIAELYRARWQVELLFKELKQTLQLRDFYGENENAVKWQIWTALLAHLLLRYLAWRSKWRASYTRFAGVVRAALWERTDLMGLLSLYGTAPPPNGMAWDEKAPCLPGFEHLFAKAMGQQMA